MRQVLVIGGGVIGLTSAWWLLEAGHAVTLLERAPHVGTGTSYRNGGQLSYRYVSPFADAGVPFKALGWMLDADGPLKFKLEADPRQWRWLLGFLGACRSTVNARTTAQLLQLGELSRQALEELSPLLPPSEYGWRQPGKLVLYRNPNLLEQAAARAAPGSEVLDMAACVRREPALADAAPAFCGGIFDSGEAVADCHAFCLALEARLQAHPGYRGRIQARATRLLTRRGRLTGVHTGAGHIPADDFVLAAGLASRDLAASAGIALPLYPIKGYSLSAPIEPHHRAPDISVTDFERKMLYARIGHQLRIAAMADLVGADLALDQRRISTLTRQARSVLPNGADYDHITRWAGLRPATPGGAPIISATRYPNLWLNVGHGALGFTLACGSARLLADLMEGRPASVDSTAYRYLPAPRLRIRRQFAAG